MNLNALRGPLFTLSRAVDVAITLGAAAPVQVRAVRYDRPTDPIFDTSTFRRVRFEIRKSEISGAPEKDDVIEDGDGTEWAIIEVLDQPEVGSWMLTVETDG